MAWGDRRGLTRDLVGIDLVGIDFVGIDFVGIDFVGIDLVGVNLVGVDTWKSVDPQCSSDGLPRPTFRRLRLRAYKSSEVSSGRSRLFCMPADGGDAEVCGTDDVRPRSAVLESGIDSPVLPSNSIQAIVCAHAFAHAARRRDCASSPAMMRALISAASSAIASSIEPSSSLSHCFVAASAFGPPFASRSASD